MAFLSAIFAALRAIPAIAGLIETLVGAWQAHAKAQAEKDAARQEVQAYERRDQKRREIDAAIARALVADGLRDAAGESGAALPTQ